MLRRRLPMGAAGSVLAAALLTTAVPAPATASTAKKPTPKTALTALSLTPSTVAAGGTVRVSMTVSNKTRAKLSKVAITITAGGKIAKKHDPVIGTTRVSSLAGGKKTTASLTAALPPALAPGAYVVRACITAPSNAKRCSSTAKTLTVTAAKPAPSTGPTPPPPASAPSPSRENPVQAPAPATPDPTPTPALLTTPAPSLLTTPVVTPPATTPLAATTPQATTPASTSPVVPSSPTGAAPSTPTTASASFATANDFLYEGPSAVQQGVEPGAISDQRLAVLRGRVLTADGGAAAGVTVTVLGATELGSTHTQADGRFDMAVNGGGSLTVTFTGTDILTVQRTVDAPWGQFTQVPDVVVLAPDPKVTAIDGNATTTQVATGTSMTDDRGTRANTLVFDPGTTASAVMPDGSTTPLGNLHVHATEYTVGDDGPARMPGPLPAESAYTYAVSLTVDEAQAAGATGVTFNKPVVDYVQDFVGFPVGSPVPVGRYDQATGHWVAAPSGRIIKVLTIAGDGSATLDVNGDGQPDTGTALTALGIDAAELGTIGAHYPAGTRLMRVQLTHFSDYDFNWESPDTRPPNLPKPEHAPDPAPDCENAGSIVGCENPSLGEELPIAGTPYALQYDSTAQPGYVASQTITVSVTGAAVSSNLDSVDVAIDVAGTHHVQHFGTAPNQTYTYRWDGRDAYGRVVSTATTATVKLTNNVRVPYSYTSSWGSTDNGGSWNGTPPQVIAPDSATWQVPLGTGRPGGRPSGATPVANWGISTHAAYDPVSHQLSTGGGTLSRADDVSQALSVVAGTGELGLDPNTGMPLPPGDGGPARDANFTFARGVVAAPSGVTYVADCVNGAVRAIGVDGIIHRFAGTGNGGGGSAGALDSYEGKPALQVPLGCPQSLAVGPDGSIYVDDENLQVVWQIRPDGTMHRVAGNGTQATKDTPVDDGGSATGQAIHPSVITVDEDGDLYLGESEEGDVLRVDPQGVLHRFAGVRWAAQTAPAISCAPVDDGQPAKGVELCGVTGLGALPGGGVLISDPGHLRIRRVGTTGTISTVVGTGDLSTVGDGEGGPASDASIIFPGAIAVQRDGSFAFTDALANVHQVGTDGILTRIAGQGTGSGTSGPENAAGYDGQPAGTGVLVGPNSAISWAPDGSLLIVAGTQNGGLGSTILRLRTALPRTGGGETAVPSADGSVVYLFDATGRHLRTIYAMTGTVRTSYGYDAAGRLTTLTDADGNVTTIERGGTGQPTAIVAPGGARTALTTNSAGELASVTDPIGRATTLTYATGSLLTGLKDGAGGQHTLTYDASGHLTADAEPGGATRHLSRTDLPGGAFAVKNTDAGGKVTTFTIDQTPAGRPRERITDPAGGVTTSTTALDGTTTLERPDGSTLRTEIGPDPRFGMAAPIVTSATEDWGSGDGERRIAARTIALGSGVFDLSGQTDTTTACASIGGDCTGSDAHPSSTFAYDKATHTITTTTPGGRTVVTTIDGHDHVVRIKPDVGADAVITWDATGHMTKVVQGSQTITYTYGAGGYPATATDALGRTLTFTYDAAGQLTALQRPGGGVIHVAYDGNGKPVSVTLPSGAVQTLHRTPSELIDQYTPSAGAAAHATFNDAGQATALTLPSGAAVSLTTDAAGRRGTTAITGAGTIGYAYATGQTAPRTVTRTAGDGVAAHTQTSTYTYRGPFVESDTEAGASAGAFEYTYDDRDRLSHVELTGDAGTDAWDVTQDEDGAATGVHITSPSRDIVATPDGPSGAPTKVVNGPQTITYTYDEQGRLATQHDVVNAIVVYDAVLTRDLLGRVTKAVETTPAGAATTTFTYDADGRLTGASRGGTPIEADSYDVDGNRTAGGAPASPVAQTFDSAGRATHLGASAVTVDDDGHETARGTDGFVYDAAGELKSATVGGVTTTYLSDGKGRRVARDRDSSTKAETYLYGDETQLNQLTASTDATGKRTTYWYDPAGRLIGLVTGAGSGANTWNYVATDWRGSPRVVTDAAGAVLDTITYSPWGIASASTPTYRLAIGFAGGLTDPDTGLVHFGARDYDPVAGRWTARDPLAYEGAVTGAYTYGRNDPVNQVDPDGLDATAAGPAPGASGGRWYDPVVKWVTDKFKDDTGLAKVEKAVDEVKDATQLKKDLDELEGKGYEDTHKGAKQASKIFGYCLQKWNDLASHLPFNPVPGNETKGLMDSAIQSIESVQGDQSKGNTYDDRIQQKIFDGN